MAGQVRPPFAYYGGKTTLAPQIAALLPLHRHYVEPFAGGMSVLLAKQPSDAETVNDLDGRLMTFWRVLRDRPRDLEHACLLTPHSRAEYVAAKAPADDELEQARRVFVLLTQGRSHSLKPTGWWYNRARDTQYPAPKTLSYAQRIGGIAERLRGVSLESRDALDVIRDYGVEADVCIYADPPYVGSTRATNYGLEMTDDDQHRAFAEACHEARASIVISGYDSALYDDLFADWHRIEMKGAVTLSNATDRVEVLWSNRPLTDGQASLLDLIGDTA